jgi:hypothetical protein
MGSEINELYATKGDPRRVSPSAQLRTLYVTCSLPLAALARSCARKSMGTPAGRSVSRVWTGSSGIAPGCFPRQRDAPGTRNGRSFALR